MQNHFKTNRKAANDQYISEKKIKPKSHKKQFCEHNDEVPQRIPLKTDLNQQIMQQMEETVRKSPYYVPITKVKGTQNDFTKKRPNIYPFGPLAFQSDVYLQRNYLEPQTYTDQVHISPNQLPYFNQQMSFDQQLLEAMQMLEKMIKLNDEFAQQQQTIQRQLQNPYQVIFNPQEHSIQAPSLLNQNEYNLRQIHAANRNLVLQIQKVNNQTLKLQDKNIITQETIRNMTKNVEHLQNRLQQEQQVLNTYQETQRLSQNKIIVDKFEISIIKMQESDTLLRYGTKITIENVKKQSVLDPNYSKFQTSNYNKSLDFIDLRIFTLSSLYPMVRSIFNDFSSQAMVFKVMLNFSKDHSSEQEKLQNFTILQSRIEKYLKQNKHYTTLQACLKSQVQIKKRKLIFICSPQKFQAIMNDLIEEIKQFHNKLIGVFNVQLQQLPDPYQNTVFDHKRLLVEYIYAKVKTSTSFDVLYADPQNVFKAQIDTLRRKTGKFEPVLFWFEIPICAKKQKMEEFVEINKMMKKCRFFSLAMEKQKEEQQKQKQKMNNEQKK